MVRVSSALEHYSVARVETAFAFDQKGAHSVETGLYSRAVELDYDNLNLVFVKVDVDGGAFAAVGVALVVGALAAAAAAAAAGRRQARTLHFGIVDTACYYIDRTCHREWAGPVDGDTVVGH